MKTIFNRKFVAMVCGISVLFLAESCTNLTDNLSTDPVNITNADQVPATLLLSGVEMSLIGVYEGDVARTAGIWSGYFAGDDRQYAGLQNYVTSGLDYDNEWVTIYTAIFNNTKSIKQKGRLAKNSTLVGVTQVIEAMAISTAADLWGDVPYSEISRYPAVTTPKFDSQASVYASAQVLLDSAIANLALPGSVGDEDFFYNGDLPSWIAAAHTVKARIYLHTRDYTNAATQAALGISSPAGSMKAPHGDAYLQNFNLYYSFLTYDRAGYMAGNSFAPTVLDPTPNNPTPANYKGNDKTSENGRLNYYYAPFYVWQGLNTGYNYDPNVLWNPDWGTNAAYDGFFAATKSFPILTFEENQLILSEASLKASPTAPANQTAALNALNNVRAYYNTGGQYGSSTRYVTSATVGQGYYDPYDLTDFGNGGTANPNNLSVDQALLTEILKERYASFIGQIEGWNDMRRTHNFLNIPITPGKTTYPKRILYSQIEFNTNPNVPASGVGLFDEVPAWTSAY